MVPDIETGGKKFWFGLRAGKEINDFSKEEFTIVKRRNVHTGKMETSYEVESGKFHKVEDKAVFCGQKAVIWKVEAFFVRGELVFRYLLRGKYDCEMIYQDKFTGLGLFGTVLETKREQVRVALDIDGGKSTGEYFYDYYPETGNALYAMRKLECVFFCISEAGMRGKGLQCIVCPRQRNGIGIMEIDILIPKRIILLTCIIMRLSFHIREAKMYTFPIVWYQQGAAES